MKWLRRIVFTVAILIGAVIAIGYLSPREHLVTRTATYDQSPEVIWAAITDYEAFPEWREAVKSVEPLPDGRPGWVEHTSFGDMPLELVSEERPATLVVRIADDSLPFGGTWTYELEATNAGTRLRITEDGEVKNPIFRFMSRFVFGYASSMEHYLGELGEKFGEESAIS